MHALTKTYVSLGLLLIATFEFWTAMRVVGDKKRGPVPHAKLLMLLHRVAGYIFAVYFVWISWVCVDLMERLYTAGNYHLDARGFGHAALAMTLFAILLLKITFIRRYKSFRPYAPLLGMILVVGTFVLWGLSGWMYLIITASTAAVT